MSYVINPKIDKNPHKNIYIKSISYLIQKYTFLSEHDTEKSARKECKRNIKEFREIFHHISKLWSMVIFRKTTLCVFRIIQKWNRSNNSLAVKALRRNHFHNHSSLIIPTRRYYPPFF